MFTAILTAPQLNGAHLCVHWIVAQIISNTDRGAIGLSSQVYQLTYRLENPSYALTRPHMTAAL